MSRANAYKATVDFETRSACALGGRKGCGAWKYSLDPSTEVLCLVFRLPYWPAGVTSLWTPPFPKIGVPENFDGTALAELLDWIAAGEPIEAHNAFFERAVWTNILTPKHGFPLPQTDSWRCSAAKAAAHALPRKLEDAGAALRLTIRKDDDGTKVMKKLSKPRKPRKKERETWAATHGNAPHPIVYFEDLALFERLWAYCRQDVLAEEALSHCLDDLNPDETTNYLLDQTMNQRGFKLDLEAVEIALDLIARESALLNAELSQLTGGLVERATQRDRMKKWLATEGVHLEDTKGSTIDAFLSDDDEDGEVEDGAYDGVPEDLGAIPDGPRRALEILRTLGRSSTAKYETMLQWACGDGRVRGGLLYHGASTGRWSGSGVQPHNFPKGTIKGFDVAVAWDLIKTGDRERIGAHEWVDKDGNRRTATVMEVLACALRGVIIPKRGHQLYVADYAGIEVRVLWWVADDKVGLELLRTGQDPYCALASDMYGRPITKSDPERQLGKAGILGCGYQMGWSKFIVTCKTQYGLTISDETSQRVVDTYRSKFHRVKQFWYDVEDTAVQAMMHKGRVVVCGRVKWLREGNFLFCILPNGRRLAYPYPELRETTTPWGAVKMQLTFMGMNSYSKKWVRQSTYGGSLVENIVQAISRDLMAGALQRCEAGGVYVPILSVHDEVIAETLLGVGDVHEFERILTECPTWATGCPIGAEGWRGLRYRK